MDSRIGELVDTIRRLEVELGVELAKRRTELAFTVRGRVVHRGPCGMDWMSALHRREPFGRPSAGRCTSVGECADTDIKARDATGNR